VSIVIPAHNEEASIERCLLAAVNQTVPAAEILVIDNRSTDATADVARRVARRHPGARIRMLSQFDEQGLVPTRNFGFTEASGDVLGRIDADTVIAPDWVEHVADAMIDPAVAAITGPVTYYDLPFRGPVGVSDDVVRRALRRLGTKYPFLYGSNMAIRATAWRAIEYDVCADPEDLLHEDIDLSVHLHDAGMRVAYARAVRADVSARRLSASPASFRAYNQRFERTYARHSIHHWYLKAPQLLLQAVYWAARVARAVSPAPRTATS
jgi:cellulose synthase/poly-beta-1,6-N-acetylglucosamine synthase-like glycosyltransferase